MSKINEPPHERSAHVDSVGRVSVSNAWCTCGRLVQPSDFEVIDYNPYRVICPACHRDVLSVG